jgi:hypothetical protein
MRLRRQSSRNPVNLVVHGNSLAYGRNSSDPATLSFASLLRDSLPPGSTYANLSYPGETTKQQINGIPAQLAALYDPTKINVFLYWEVRNDLATNITTAERATERLRAVCRGAQNTGWRVFSPTLVEIPLLNPALVPAFNTYLRANYLEFSDGIVDVEADPYIGWGVHGDNPTYYYGDNPPPPDTWEIHFTDAGHARCAAICLPVLNALIAMGARTPLTQFAFALPTLAGRWGNAVDKALTPGYWRSEDARGIDIYPGGAPAATTYNGLPAWLLDGVDDEFHGFDSGNGYTEFRLSGSGADSGVVNVDMSIFMVVELLAAGSYPIVFCYPSATIELRGDGGTGNPSSVNASDAVTGAASIVGSKHVLLVTVSGVNGSAVQTLYLDGVQVGSPITPGAAGAFDVKTLVIGSRGAGSLNANMKVAEIVVLSSVATSTERHNVGAYLATTWGTPAVP